jgi:hypothetical protein
MSDLMNDPAHWRHRARTRAEQMSDPEARAAMLQIAAD